MNAEAKYSSIVRRITGESRADVLETSAVSGGSINRCTQLKTNRGFFFLKENSAKEFPGMFEAESRGLQLLAETKTFIVPKPLGIAEENGTAFLLLSWLEKTSAHQPYEGGTTLAKLHRNHAKSFGLDHDNYIGSLKQSNRQHNSWEDFFALERILPQVKLARDSGKADAALAAQAEKFCGKIADIFPAEKPSLLHGDLWSGNFFVSARAESGEGPAVFDPAVYYGHREMDLAMTQLFGGFNADFYAGYENEFPLEKSWKKRVEYCNLYPLLVHVNLFGGGYVQDVKSLLRQF
jgi:protein-ribulosamine 3-kinase